MRVIPLQGMRCRPPSRAASRAAKKRKTAKKNRDAPDLDSDVTSGDERPSVHDALQTLTTMMVTLSSRLDGLEEGRH